MCASKSTEFCHQSRNSLVPPGARPFPPIRQSGPRFRSVAPAPTTPRLLFQVPLRCFLDFLCLCLSSVASVVLIGGSLCLQVMKNFTKNPGVPFGSLDRFTKKAGDEGWLLMKVLPALLFQERSEDERGDGSEARLRFLRVVVSLLSGRGPRCYELVGAPCGGGAQGGRRGQHPCFFCLV